MLLLVDGRSSLSFVVHVVCSYRLCVLFVGVGWRCVVFGVWCCRAFSLFVWRSLFVPRDNHCLLSRLRVWCLFDCSLSCLVSCPRFSHMRPLLCSVCFCCLLLL